jgi:outer membrane protein TolC
VETGKINLLLAESNRLWDLSLSTGVNSFGLNTNPWRSSETAWSAGKSDWNVGLTLTIPFRDLTIEQTYLSNKIALEQSRLDLKKAELTIEINLKNALRDVDMKLKQMNKARQARELAQKKYEVENDKYKAGRSTNFQLVSYQNDLVTAEQNEVSNLIDYLNSLTALDAALGTTLRTWNIEISKDTDKVKVAGKATKLGQESK